jgi:acetate kinase
MSVLVLNAGSSTLKFTLFEEASFRDCAEGIIDWKSNQGTVTIRPAAAAAVSREITVADSRTAVAQVLRLVADCTATDPVTACGHRIVHGGERLRESVRIDASVKQALASLNELAPLHNPPALAGIASAEAALPGIPQVGVFDTAFFRTLAPAQFLYPVPRAWYAEWGIRRFGFHGISHAYCTVRAAELLPAGPDLRLIVCHLGNGCSASAVRGGQALATTMGFTPMEGLMMGTRAGSVDAGILLYLQRTARLDHAGLERDLNLRSGLLGVSGVSADYREVESAAAAGDEQARLALTMFADRVRSTVGALAVTLGGVDALVFTAGIGENSASLRAEACRGLECLGIHLDPDRNETCRPDADLAHLRSTARILIVHTREDLLIARETRRVTDPRNAHSEPEARAR